MAPQQYKLKYNPADVEKPGTKVEAEVEGVQDCKVLLLNVGGNLKAVSLVARVRLIWNIDW